jgi:hypothetical protein
MLFSSRSSLLAGAFSKENFSEFRRQRNRVFSLTNRRNRAPSENLDAEKTARSEKRALTANSKKIGGGPLVRAAEPINAIDAEEDDGVYG